ncbi:hypothetical protein TBLA_0A05690 [Henningerozyma blattae CBS 6284]|uniref:Uncharacterized protein n=1 Tax=Henningerozyma blattae (strain ATCC 34711 / CBS 6284 / DSM 70876 / NBRC 10599 / NRRL Y-10934 / UCD 77-7) TaxID=1071380 RepID=I2GW60_HENB6|nr:hypothetical protein TBLA_0A05690 [Tetrapisispora blattae CBS 6284]CCH58362.1 hypothetical protein TBLA_0A05690 [Tetrapisispora blattae CBS 6284]
MTDLLQKSILTSEDLLTQACKEAIDSFKNSRNQEDIADERLTQILSRSRSRFSGPIPGAETVSLRFHPSGRNLAYSRMDGSVTAWSLDEKFNLKNKIYVSDIVGSDKLITSISWNPNELNQFITAGNTSELIIWSVDYSNNSINKLKTMNLHNRVKINNCMFDPTGKWLIAATKSGQLNLFEVDQDFKLISGINVSEFANIKSLRSIIWNNSGKYLFIGSKCGLLLILKLDPVSKEFSLVSKMMAHCSSISTLSIDPLGRYLVSGSEDGSCVVWDLESLTCKFHINDLGDGIISLDIDSLGKIIGIVTEHNKILFYELNTGKSLDEIDLASIESDVILKFYPHMLKFITSGKNDTLKIYTSTLAFKKLTGDAKNQLPSHPKDSRDQRSYGNRISKDSDKDRSSYRRRNANNNRYSRYSNRPRY